MGLIPGVAPIRGTSSATAPILSFENFAAVPWQSGFETQGHRPIGGIRLAGRVGIREDHRPGRQAAVGRRARVLSPAGSDGTNPIATGGRDGTNPIGALGRFQNEANGALGKAGEALRPDRDESSGP